jgi:hypothetical protein
MLINQSNAVSKKHTKLGPKQEPDKSWTTEGVGIKCRSGIMAEQESWNRFDEVRHQKSLNTVL